MSIIKNAQAHIATEGTKNVKSAFRNEEGAIDLASIMVGIIVIGIIGGVVAATVFAVIPWTQDNAAKQQLESVVTAQSAYIGLAADASGSAYTYGTKAQLGGTGGVTTQSLFAAPSNVQIAVTGTGANAAYGAVSASDSGAAFSVTNANPKAAKSTGATPAAAVTAAKAATGTTLNAATWS